MLLRGALIIIAAAVVAAYAAAGIGGPAVAGGKLNTEMTVLVDSYLEEARKTEPGLKGFSAEDGKRLFTLKKDHTVKKESRGCTTCHTTDPSATGKTPVGKAIKPISPAANPERLTSPKKVKKWFKRNCKWVLERECTPKEKGDFITYMMSL